MCIICVYIRRVEAKFVYYVVKIQLLNSQSHVMEWPKLISNFFFYDIYSAKIFNKLFDTKLNNKLILARIQIKTDDH